MTKKTLLSPDKELSLLENVLTENDPISKRILEIHYANEESKNHEDSETSKPII
jgi:hypothetical protein